MTGITEFAAEHDWLTLVALPKHAPEINPTEGIWSLIKRGPLASLVPVCLDEVAGAVRFALKRIQYRTVLIGFKASCVDLGIGSRPSPSARFFATAGSGCWRYATRFGAPSCGPTPVVVFGSGRMPKRTSLLAEARRSAGPVTDERGGPGLRPGATRLWFRAWTVRLCCSARPRPTRR
ncbi:hypothetical protein ABH926_009186 [Catenulispora sp. GP43]